MSFHIARLGFAKRGGRWYKKGKRRTKAVLHTFETLFPRYPGAQCYSNIRGQTLAPLPLSFQSPLVQRMNYQNLPIGSGTLFLSLSLFLFFSFSEAKILTYIGLQGTSSFFRM